MGGEKDFGRELRVAQLDMNFFHKIEVILCVLNVKYKNPKY
jgi:hypothetical protein